MGQRVSPADLGALHEDLAAKQAADVIGFLVTAAELDVGFRDRARPRNASDEPTSTNSRASPRARHESSYSASVGF